MLIYENNHFFLAKRNDDKSGAGTWCDPISITSAEDFDNFLKFHDNCTIHLLAGTYETRGYSEAFPDRGSYLNTKTKIIGEGGVTIKLIEHQGNGWLRVISNPVGNLVPTDTTECVVKILQ